MGKKLELLGEKWNEKLKPITEYQLEYHRKKSARYLFVWNKETQDGFCQACESNFIFDHKTKHLSLDKCPRCGKEIQVHHAWRTQNYPTEIKFMVIPKTLDNHTLVLRYIEASNSYNEPRLNVREVARMYIDEYRSQPEYWCFTSRYFYYYEKEPKMNWFKGKEPYFVHSRAFYVPNLRFCGDAYEYPRNFFKEINKLDCFKYYPIEDIYDFQGMSMQLHYLVRSARVNEKLSKLDLGIPSIQDYHRSYYINNGDRCFPLDNTKTKLNQMLKLDRENYKLLMSATFNIGLLKFLQKNPHLNHGRFVLANYNYNLYEEIKNFSKKLDVTFEKFGRYIQQFTGMDGRASYYEYKHYLRTLEELHYDIRDIYYSMPKDFKKADKKLTEEYNRIQEERRAREREKRLKEDMKKDELIAKISKGLMELPEIKELCGNSRGLLVYVPESSKDLYEEGKALHNCLSTYVNRVANKNTLIFFVRQLQNPMAPFVAMEIAYDGTVIQVRYDHNKPVEDSNIIDFASKVAQIVKKHASEIKAA